MNSTRIFGCTILLATLVLAGCGGGGGGNGTTPAGNTADVTAPTVSSTSPANAATGVVTGTSISITFSEAMDCNTLTTTSFTLNDGAAVAGAVACNNATATFTPTAALASNTLHTATVTTVAKDVAGNALASNHSWTFSTAATVPAALAAGKVAAGDRHSCAIMANNTLACWGNNNSGQVGIGSASSAWPTPQSVPLSGSVSMVAAGNMTSCAIHDTDDKLSCWGSVPGGNGTQRSPMLMASNVLAVAVGNAHVCYISNLAGAVYCFGDNSIGQLGHGYPATALNATPVAVGATPSGTLDGAIAIAAGSFHTCALLSSGAVCWGAVNFELDNLGNPTVTSSAFTSGDLPATGVQLAAGTQHTCARLGDGTVRCWGSNSSGQLGQGNVSAGSYATALEVSGLANVVDIASSGNQICATTAGGTVYCWGNGHMGNGSQTTTTVTQPTAVAGLIDARAAAIGTSPHACVLRANGALVCWGSGMDYQLGDGQASARSTPNAVSGGTTFWQ